MLPVIAGVSFQTLQNDLSMQVHASLWSDRHSFPPAACAHLHMISDTMRLEEFVTYMLRHQCFVGY